jgi:hypothetical protein
MAMFSFANQGLIQQLRTTLFIVKRGVKSIYWYFINYTYKTDLLSIKSIPIVINNYNRVTYLIRLIEFLEKCDINNIIIIDNNSTYPPLLEYYKTCPYPIIREQVNHGHLALWKTGLYKKLRWNYFVYTDSDVLPINECPITFLSEFKLQLDKYIHLDKIGFGIKIDDLPDYFLVKEKVIRYERNYWLNLVKKNPMLYDAPIDTTFALYKPFSGLIGGHSFTLKSYRFGYPYLIRHLPWYIDTKNPNEEEIYYIKESNNSSSLSQQIKGKQNIY